MENLKRLSKRLSATLRDTDHKTIKDLSVKTFICTCVNYKSSPGQNRTAI